MRKDHPAPRGAPRGGRRTRRLPTLGGNGVDRKLRWIIAAYLIVAVAIVGYNAEAIAKERGKALAVNVAARQRALGERYMKDVLLVTDGRQADPKEDANELLANADALLHGGNVDAVQGADALIRIPPASSDPLVLAKFTEEKRLVEKLIAAGSGLMHMSPTAAGFGATVQNMRIIGGQVTSVSNDAVGQMTRNTERAFSRLVVLGITLGVLGAMVAIGMALLLRRTAAQRSAQFRSLVHNGSDLITVVDPEGMIRYQSPSAERLVGSTSEELVGTRYLNLVDVQDVGNVRAVLEDLTGETGATATAEYRVRHVDGSSRFVESIVTNRLDDQNVKGLVLNTRDVTDRKILEDELAHQAFHDSLTGLSNRAVFRDRVDHALARTARSGLAVSVLLLDLDGFKMINDSLGHDAGDELLVAVGGRLQACARSSDTVARLGGDEFVILLEDEGNQTRATAVADRLLRQLMEPFQVRGREVFVRASIGIAIGADSSSTPDELIRNADTAMYEAKSAGKGRYEIFHPIMHAQALRQFEIQADLQRALGGNEFVLHYQPIVDIATGTAGGVEALVRWQHPKRGLLPPIEFIPVAEDTGMIVPIGNWVLHEACRQAAEWRRSPASPDLWMSVNLSTRQLLEPDVVDQVRRALHETGLPASALVLEITEGTLMQDMGQTIEKLRALKELGVRLAIDDFGTGSSSLGYLRQFPVDVIKIDKSFVDEVATSGSQGPALVRAIIELAQTLRLETVAEGIELTEQAEQLGSAGCHTGQGFLFARPLTPDAMEAFLGQGGNSAAAEAIGEMVSR
jgi:diguanylate cyclase (GGDEF)-like protein/PAS domain S-box-containing protein